MNNNNTTNIQHDKPFVPTTNDEPNNSRNAQTSTISYITKKSSKNIKNYEVEQSILERSSLPEELE
jgi:hypothetical protein